MFDLHVEMIMNEQGTECFEVKCPVSGCDWSVSTMDKSKDKNLFAEQGVGHVYHHLTVSRSHIHSYREQEQWLIT